jgi:hypothetical protein
MPSADANVDLARSCWEICRNASSYEGARKTAERDRRRFEPTIGGGPKPSSDCLISRIRGNLAKRNTENERRNAA